MKHEWAVRLSVSAWPTILAAAWGWHRRERYKTRMGNGRLSAEQLPARSGILFFTPLPFIRRGGCSSWVYTLLKVKLRYRHVKTKRHEWRYNQANTPRTRLPRSSASAAAASFTWAWFFLSFHRVLFQVVALVFESYLISYWGHWNCYILGTEKCCICLWFI
jgi:hypothetical protein